MKKILFSLLISTLVSAECLEYSTNIEVGVCYEKEGNLILAQAAYERALIADEEDTSARQKLMALYHKMGMNSEADQLNKKLSAKERTSLAAVQGSGEIKNNTFRARAELDIGYDNNIDFNPVADTTLTQGGDTAETAFSRLQADMSYLYDIGELAGWYLRTDADIFIQENFSAHDYDVFFGRVYAGAGYRGINYSLYLPLFYDRINYLDRALMQERGIHPNLDLQLHQSLILNLNLLYSQRRYIQDYDQGRDDNMYSAGAGLFWLKGGNLLYFKTGYELYKATHQVPIAFTEKQVFSASIGALYSFGNIIDLRADYQLRYHYYALISTSDGNIQRGDTNHEFTVALEKEFFNDFRAQLQYRNVNNISNYALATYKKDELLFGVIYNY